MESIEPSKLRRRLEQFAFRNGSLISGRRFYANVWAAFRLNWSPGRVPGATYYCRDGERRIWSPRERRRRRRRRRHPSVRKRFLRRCHDSTRRPIGFYYRDPPRPSAPPLRLCKYPQFHQREMLGSMDRRCCSFCGTAACIIASSRVALYGRVLHEIEQIKLTHENSFRVVSMLRVVRSRPSWKTHRAL